MVFLVVLIAAGWASIWYFLPPSKDVLLENVQAARLDQGGPGSLVVFLKINNHGGPDKLLSANAHDATETILYSPEAEQGVPIPGKTSPSLAADGAHIVMRGIDGPIEDGRLFPVALTFEKAGTVTSKARLVAPVKPGDAADSGLFGLGSICRVGEGEPAPEISVRAEPMSDGAGWRIHVDAEDFTFAEHLAGTEHIPGVGHGHLYVGGLKIRRLYGPVTEIGLLPAGTHTVRITLNTNDHRAYVVDDRPVTAQTEIVVN
jgi:copper(I)-binding protein